MIVNAVELAVKDVVEPRFTVAVSVDHLLGVVGRGDAGEGALRLEDIGRRVVKKDDEFAESGRLGLLEGGPQPRALALGQLFSVSRGGLVPAENLTAAV